MQEWPLPRLEFLLGWQDRAILSVFSTKIVTNNQIYNLIIFKMNLWPNKIYFYAKGRSSGSVRLSEYREETLAYDSVSCCVCAWVADIPQPLLRPHLQYQWETGCHTPSTMSSYSYSTSGQVTDMSSYVAVTGTPQANNCCVFGLTPQELRYLQVCRNGSKIYSVLETKFKSELFFL